MSLEYFSFEDLLQSLGDSLPDQSFKRTKNNELHTSQKPVYELAKKVLGSDQSELAVQLKEVLHLLDNNGIAVPVVHITSDSIQTLEGKIVSTRFWENIKTNGLNGNRATNVGGFIFHKDGKVSLGTPQDFIDKPLQFVRALVSILINYIKHGTRTNKSCLGPLQNKGQGIPIMIMVDPTNLPLTRGSDPGPHYQFKNAVSCNRIIGKVELSQINECKAENWADNLRVVANAFLTETQKYIQKTKSL